jgi:hypothetical protein
LGQNRRPRSRRRGPSLLDAKAPEALLELGLGVDGSRNRDVDRAVGADDAREGPSRQVAEERVGTGSEYRADPAAKPGERRLADGVDAAVKRVEAAALDAPVDSVRPEAEPEELAARYDAMLPSRERGERVLLLVSPRGVAHFAAI